MITIDDVKNYLGIDYTDTMVDNNIQRAINTAKAYIEGAIGKNTNLDDPRAKVLMLIVVSDLYDNRGITDKVSATVRKLVYDFMLQLQVEQR